MSEQNVLRFSRASELWESSNRRSFLKVMAAGGAVVLLPSMLTGCDGSSSSKSGLTGPGGTGTPLTIDFSTGDTAVLQFAFVLEQLEADFYAKVVAAFASGSAFSTAEQAILGDIRYHEAIHRDFFKAVLGTNGTFTIDTAYPHVDFTDRTSVLTTAQSFEFLGVAAYNGAAQYITDPTTLTLAGKIVSVEARHAAAIADLLSPKTSAFAPQAFENVFHPSKVAVSAQPYVVEYLTLKNPPSYALFVDGPNANGL